MIVVRVESVKKVISVQQNTQEFKVIVTKGSDEFAKQEAVKAAISAEAARLSDISAAESEQAANQQAGISTAKAIESAQSAAQSLVSKNQAAAILANTLTGGAVAGQISFWNGPKNLIGDAAFVWDNVNKRLGIGGVPLAKLHAYGSSDIPQIIIENSLSQSTVDRVGFRVKDNIFSLGSLTTLGSFFKTPIQFNTISGQVTVNEDLGFIVGKKIFFGGAGNSFIQSLSINNTNIFAFVSLNLSTNERSIRCSGNGIAFHSGPNGTGNTNLIVTSQGNTLISTTIDSGHKLNVNGNLRVQEVLNATGNPINISATGVFQQRTPLQHINDILTALPGYNAAIFQTLTHNSSGVIAWT